jgi:hypothetical protein
MAFSGVQEFHVSGLASIYVFSPTSYLGYSSEAGVQLDFDPKFLPIYTDAFGDQVPEDIQNMGMLASLNFELIKWDMTVLAALQTFAGNFTSAPTTKGDYPNADASGNLQIGLLRKQCNWTFPLTINRQTSSCETNKEGPYTFGTCYVGADSFNLGTRHTRHRLTVHCLPNASGQLFVVGSTGY